jgi:hypothetical protein
MGENMGIEITLRTSETITQGSILEKVNFISSTDKKAVGAIKNIKKDPSSQKFKDCGDLISKYGTQLSKDCTNM